MTRIATDTYSFDKLRNGGYLYVDKTGEMLPLVDGSAGKQFFCARPRRFGKSLLISTLAALYEGKKELFTGLKIERNWDWAKKWPVIRLDMGSCQANSLNELRLKIHDLLSVNEDRLGVDSGSPDSPSIRFRQLISSAVAKTDDGMCVLLIDEYDKPLLGRLGREDVAEFRDELKAFYSVIKTMEGCLKFTLLTGVSKFSKVSIFSDLNNLTDITMDPRFPRLFGYTHEEVLENFGRGLPELAEKNDLPTPEAAFERLKEKYDGYRFEEDAPLVFNPVSVGKCFATGKFNDFWFETGTPTFLVRLMRENPISLDNLEMPASAFGVYEPARPALVPILFQTGYLTIKDSHMELDERIYSLGFPNAEVRRAFSESLSKELAQVDEVEHASLLNQMCRALRAGDINDMLDALSCFFANIPANITVKKEKYYQSLFYALFVLIGARIHAEGWTNRGRIDATVETADTVYVFEFKLNDTAEAALAQIKEKGYDEKYRRDGKRLVLAGVAFDAEMRNLSDRRIEER